MGGSAFSTQGSCPPGTWATAAQPQSHVCLALCTGRPGDCLAPVPPPRAHSSSAAWLLAFLATATIASHWFCQRSDVHARPHGHTHECATDLQAGTACVGLSQPRHRHIIQHRHHLRHRTSPLDACHIHPQRYLRHPHQALPCTQAQPQQALPRTCATPTRPSAAWRLAFLAAAARPFLRRASYAESTSQPHCCRQDCRWAPHTWEDRADVQQRVGAG